MQVLVSVSEPGFALLRPPEFHSHTAAVFLQLTCTAMISWLGANLCVGGFRPGVASGIGAGS